MEVARSPMSSQEKAFHMEVALQRPARVLVADFDRTLEAQVPRAHAQSLPGRLSGVMANWDEEDLRQKSHSLIELVRRDSLLSDHPTDHHAPLLENVSDPIAAFLEKWGMETEILEARGIHPLFLNLLLSKELAYSRHLRWAAIDYFPERMLQGLLLGQEDLKPSTPSGSARCLSYLSLSPRCMPQGRSLLLKAAFGLQKIHAAQGLIDTTHLILVQTINLFIGVSLSYRLYASMHTGHVDFAEFRSVFEATNQRGVKSLVHLLSGIPETGLWFLLFSPLMAGVVKGLWDIRCHQALSDGALRHLQQRVEAHRRPLQDFQQKVWAYVWADTLRQKLSVPCWPSLSDEIQGAERALCWDGRLRAEREKCQRLFETIERVALQGRAFSQMRAMQSLGKIVHSLSIKDFERLQVAGYSSEIFMDILAMKTQSLEHLYALAGKYPAGRASDSQTVSLGSSIPPQAGWVSTLYAHYLLWWLGMHDSKFAAAFWVEKLLKLTLQGLFLKTMIESVLELIRCPDRAGFRMFYGDYEIWANQLTAECFKEFVRRFRLVSHHEPEPIKPFVEQLKHFDLRDIETLDLSNKNLTGDEIRLILKALRDHGKLGLRTLILKSNEIANDTRGMVFPETLWVLDLSGNGMGATGAEGLVLPASLQSLDLNWNVIGEAGARALTLPPRLQILNLSGNHIREAGVQTLTLPASLQSLDLSWNSIGEAGARALTLPANLRALYLGSNRIGNAGARVLKLPPSLQILDLNGNQLGAEGTWGLNLHQTPNLRTLDLSWNAIGEAAAEGLQWPASLEIFILNWNQLDDEGAEALNLRQSPNLQSLDLSWNDIGDAGVAGLRFPASLQALDLSNNKIGDAGAGALQLPLNLWRLDLSRNAIGTAGAEGLQLPASLRILDLNSNQLGDGGAEGLGLPASLEALDLSRNAIGEAGARGLVLPARLETFVLSGNPIGTAGAAGLRLPARLQMLALNGNQLGAEGARSLQLPASLQRLYLSSNQLGDGVQTLQLPASLQALYLSENQIGDEGIRGLDLHQSPELRELYLSHNKIGDEGAEGLALPPRLQKLVLEDNQLGPAGARALKLRQSPKLTELYLSHNKIGDEGAEGLALPPSLETLSLRENQIGTVGVRALIVKIGATKITTIDLLLNPYNASLVNVEGAIEQQRLLKLCHDQLCHANTPLALETSKHFSSEPIQPLIFSRFQAPLNRINNTMNGSLSLLTSRIDEYFTKALYGFGHYLRSTLSDCPSYFPNINAPDISDWPSAGTALWQFKAAHIGSPSPLPIIASTTVPWRLAS